MAGVSRQEHERHRADRGEQDLVRQVERKAFYGKRKSDQEHNEERVAHALRAGLQHRGILCVADAEVAARARDAHTRSSSSFVPNRPHGRTASMASSTKNGTTSESSGST